MKLIKLDRGPAFRLRFDWCIEDDNKQSVATSNRGPYTTREIRDDVLKKTILAVRCDTSEFTTSNSPNSGAWALGVDYDIYFPRRYSCRQDALAAIHHVCELLRSQA